MWVLIVALQKQKLFARMLLEAVVTARINNGGTLSLAAALKGNSGPEFRV
jgi:hypothetical protein